MIKVPLSQGVVRLEYVTNTADYIESVMEKVKPKYLTQAYKVCVNNNKHVESYNLL